MFAQTNYLEKQGRISPSGKAPIYGIDVIGCLLTSNSNLIKRLFNLDVSPVQLNAFFRDQKVYSDTGDGYFDDLNWNSICFFRPDLSYATGTGWPTSDNSIVRFHYRSISHPTVNGKPNIIDHFCLVASAANKTIIDSWDGKEKSPGAYGQPVDFASYSIAAPMPVTPIIAPAPAANAGRQIFLPAAAGTWRVYPLGVVPVPGHEVGKLAPASFPPGLTYDILDVPAPNTYTILTNSLGRVNVWGGSNTIAEFIDKTVTAPQTAPPVLPPPIEVVATPVVPVTANDDKVEVKVIKTDPDAWKKITLESKYYNVNTTFNVVDYSGQQKPRQIIKGTLIHTAGWFEKGGIRFRIRQTSIDNGWFYGFPEDTLESPDEDDLIHEEDLHPTDTSLRDGLEAEKAAKRKKYIAVVAAYEGAMHLIKSVFKKNKKGTK